MESRAPAASRTAPTTLEVMNATAQQDTDSTQTDVAVMVCLAKCACHSYFNEMDYLLPLNLGEFQFAVNMHSVFLYCFSLIHKVKAVQFLYFSACCHNSWLKSVFVSVLFRCRRVSGY